MPDTASTASTARPARRPRTLRGLALAAAAAAAAAVLPAHAAPLSVAITSPAAGSTVSLTDTGGVVPVTGTASFGPAVPGNRVFFARRDGCATGADPKYLSVKAGSGETTGCNFLLPPAVVDAAGGAEESFPATDGVPLVLDGSRPAVATVVTSGGGGGGQADLTASLSGVTEAGDAVVLGQGAATYTQLPAGGDHTQVFSWDVPDALTGVRVTDLQLTIKVVGLVVQHGGVAYNGKTKVDVPLLDEGDVQVSTSPTFTAARTVTAVRDGDAWSAELTPPSGPVTVYARGVQGTARLSATPVAVTVVP